MALGYKTFYNGRTHDVYADSSLQAQEKAAKHFKVKPRKQYMISVVLCEDANGNVVTHSTASF